MAASMTRDGSLPAFGGPRRVFLCADDYGLSPGVDAAIRDLLARRRLSATSAMVVTPTFGHDEARALATLAGTTPFAVGLHVTLTAPHRPLAQAFRPVHGGEFPNLGRLMMLALSRRLDPAVLATEIAAQLDRFIDAFGRPPDFVDGHQHVQLLPRIRDAFLAMVREKAPRAWVRQCGRTTPIGRRLQDRKGLVLDLLSHRFRRRASAFGIATNPGFAGTYDFGNPQRFSTVFPQFLDGLPDGGVIMCHPGKVDDQLVCLDPLTTRREEELAFFASEDFPALLGRADATLA
jgi:chitin disaccharide deacetylase